MEHLLKWNDILICPLDRSPLQVEDDLRWICPTCGFSTDLCTEYDRPIPDFRAVHVPQDIALSLVIPITPLDRYELIETCFKVSQAKIPRLPKKMRTTKIGDGQRYYCLQAFDEFGPDAPVLDLGCGAGGNRVYLQSIGFKNILAVDWIAQGADILADAHRLPLSDESFQVVLSTAVFEHLYNPFVAVSEVSRILRPGGHFIGGASFWEAWHGSSYFHITPDGWHALSKHADLELEDLWSGWGIIPPLLHHVLTPGYFRKLGYALQFLVEQVYYLAMGEAGVRKLQLRASGSYHVFARKPQKQSNVIGKLNKP